MRSRSRALMPSIGDPIWSRDDSTLTSTARANATGSKEGQVRGARIDAEEVENVVMSCNRFSLELEVQSKVPHGHHVSHDSWLMSRYTAEVFNIHNFLPSSYA